MEQSLTALKDKVLGNNVTTKSETKKIPPQPKLSIKNLKLHNRKKKQFTEKCLVEFYYRRFIYDDDNEFVAYCASDVEQEADNNEEVKESKETNETKAYRTSEINSK